MDAAAHARQLTALVVTDIPRSAPIILDTACFSMYSDISTRTMALSSSNMNCATPSPVPFTHTGRPRKMKLPMGRLGSLKPRGCGESHSPPATPLHPDDHAIMQPVFHMINFCTSPSSIRETEYRSTWPRSRDILFVDLFL